MTRYSLFFIVFFVATAFSQKFDRLAVENFQKELNAEYMDAAKSPLLANDRAVFKGHWFYPIDEKYFVIAEFVRSQKSDILRRPGLRQ